jgi:molybdopterin-guanine dinucleotide biosynthesis protein A
MGRENNCLCSFKNCFLPLYIPISCELTKYLAKVFNHQPDKTLIQPKQQQYSVKMMLESLKGLQIQPFKNTQLNNINTAVQWQKRCAEQSYTKA